MKHDDAAKDKPMMVKVATKVAKKAVKGHEGRMHKGFAKGGKTNANMKSMGRGMAKVVNQRSSSKSRGR
ncbi:hypothetical protein UFOVP1295_59 [uncultured Caudovirales phage]|uniref:Uncharacterized protein n=1 Tax=uncultured Caudovirales phage TaxID=2100421 RepID=A0A6J5RW02_9CAUD|nr:hypothetical protein UFOVP1295_59 [uncultured Caudovirales phage]